MKGGAKTYLNKTNKHKGTFTHARVNAAVYLALQLQTNQNPAI